ncbi:unnamed protein product, partial [Mesorhabditis belari]|uniref:Uncharacterized protein n=1 Tax=Mesorhabditis belari TaxID=2138241 RepID=A0AAF3EUB5_9BILA
MNLWTTFVLLFMIDETRGCLSSSSGGSFYGYGGSRAAASADDPNGGIEGGGTPETAFYDDSQSKTKTKGITFDEFETRKGQCERAQFKEYTAGEMRNIATIVDYPHKSELSVGEGGRLSCGFDQEREFCAWFNNGSVSFSKAIYRDAFNRERFDCTSPRGFGFDEYFLLAGGESLSGEEENRVAILQIDIPCQLGEGTLKFDFWTNSYSVQLKVCMQIEKQEEPICEYMTNPENPLTIPFPGSGDPFKLWIEVNGLDEKSIVLLDNIRYDGQLCQMKTATTDLQSAQKDARTLSICEVLPCNFNHGNTCFYSLNGIGSTSPWLLSDRFLGNKLTGVHKDDYNDIDRNLGYVYVGNDYAQTEEEVFVMESPKFVNDRSDVFLIFDLFLRSFGPQLRVCIDSFDYCPYSNPQVNKTKFWFIDQKVYLPVGMKKVYFIAGKVHKHQFLAVDNIRLEKEGNRGNPCKKFGRTSRF